MKIFKKNHFCYILIFGRKKLLFNTAEYLFECGLFKVCLNGLNGIVLHDFLSVFLKPVNR